MLVQTNSKKAETKVRFRSIALPNEHGAWGFLFEPLICAIAISPSVASIWIFLLVVGAFLTRQPLKIWINDKLAKRFLPQTELAFKLATIFGSVSLVGLFGSLLTLNLRQFIPFLIIIPLLIFQIYSDSKKQSRQLLPELTGAIAISSSSAVIALAGGLDLFQSFALWGVFISRFIPSIIYVRNRLRLEKGKEFLLVPVIGSHFIAVGVVGMMAGNGFIPYLSLPVFIWLMLRAFWGLSPFRKKVKAIRIGIWEVIYGLLTVLSLILGFYFKI